LAVNNPYGPSGGSSERNRNNPYGSPAPAPAPKAPALAVTAPKAPAKQEELPAILGLGQGILKVLLTSGAGGVGALDAITRNLVKGEDNNPLDSAGSNIAALWNTKDLFGAGAWDKVVTGESYLKNTLGVEEKMLTLPAAFAQNLPGLRTLAARSIGRGEANKAIPVGTNTFWGGFAVDVASDPLSYSMRALTSVIKGGVQGGSNALTAGRLAKAGEIAESVARAKVGKDAPVAVTNNFGSVGAFRTPQNLQSVKSNILKVDPKAAKVITKAEERLANNVYKTTRVDAPRGLSETAKDVVASAIDASVKSISNSYVSARTATFLQRYAKRDVTGVFNRRIVANVAKDPESGRFLVLSGNKVKLGEAATEFEAKKLASDLQKGLNPMVGLTPVGTIAGARQVAQDADAGTTTAVVPTKEGSEVELEKFVPHDAENGEFYVYDGENVAAFESLADAEAWIDIYQSPAQRNVEPVVTGKSGAYQVNIGGEVTRFKTKAEANAYADAARTGQLPTSRTMTRGGVPIIDSVPAQVTVKEALKVPSKAEASALRSVLKGLDDVSKKTSGWRSAISKDVSERVLRILSPRQARIDEYLMKVPDALLRDVKLFVEQDLSIGELMSVLEKTTDPLRIQMKRLLETMPVQASKGTITFADALQAAKGKFYQITEAVEGTPGNSLEDQILRKIDTEIVKRGMALKSGKVKPAFDPEGRFQALTAEVGEKVANQIRKTGYLTEASKANRAKLDKVLSEISVNNNEVFYTGYDDLIKGLERGDDVSQSALEEIFKLIDPDGGIVSKVGQAAAEPAGAFLRRVFTREGGVATIREAEKRLAMMRDPEMLMKHANLAYEAEVVQLIKILDSENAQAVADITTASTRQVKAESFAANYGSDVQRDAADSLGRMIMGDPKKGGQRGIISDVNQLLRELGGELRVSSLDDYYYGTLKPYEDGSRAILARQLQQSAETKLINSLLGKLKNRQAGAKEAGSASKNPRAKLAWLEERLFAANDAANGLGFRFVRTKNRDDVTFQNAYSSALEAGKGSKNKLNFSALSQKHTVYLPMPEILRAIRLNGGETALLRAFFPTGTKDVAAASMDWISLGDAARRVIEMDAAGEVIDVNEIATRILKRGSERGMPSKTRVQSFKGIANELAEVLTQPEVIAQLKGVHLDNAASIIKDSIEKADAFNADLFNIMEEAWATMHLEGNLTEAARMEAVRTYFRKFIMASDIMRLEGGPVAEAMFRASAMMFADGGKVPPPSKLGEKLPAQAAEFWNLLRDEEYKLFREAMTRLYRYQDLPSAPPGREGMKAPKPAAKEAAQKGLDEAESLYKTHMDKLSEIEATGDVALVAQWEKTHRKLQTKLDKARELAWNNWVPTRHFFNGQWIDSAKFDRNKALRQAQQQHNAYVAGKRGAADRDVYLADSEPVVPPHRKLSKAEKAKFLAKFEKESNIAQVENAKSQIDDAAQNVADEVDAGRLGMDDLAPNEKMMLGAQNAMVRAIREGSTIKTRRVLSSYKATLPNNPREFNQLVRPGLDPDTPVFFSDRIAANMRLLGEQWSGYTGRQDVAPLLKRAENTSVTDSTNFAEALDSIARYYKNASVQDYDVAWTALRDGAELPADASAFAKGLRRDLEMFTNTIFRSSAESVLVTQGISGSALADMFQRFGLKEEYGLPLIGNLKGKTPIEIVDSLFDELPFGSVPSAIQNTDKAIAWGQRREAFRNSGLTPLLAFTRMMEAVQMVKMEQTVAHQATAQFGWKQHFKNINDAIDEGWVAIDSSGPNNIARFIPGAEDGGLFHPAIADQLGSVFREYNASYNDAAGNAKLRRVINSVMQIVGVLKFTQTTLMPRHHVTNAVGDSVTAIIAGTTNPVDWFDGFRITSKFTELNFAADWAKFGKDFEAKAMRIVGAFADEPGATMPRIGQPDEVRLSFYKDGKPTAEVISLDRLVKDFGDAGIIVPGFVQADIQGFAGDLALQGATANQRKAFGQMWQNVSRGGRTFMKGFSDFTATYSNGIRAAHAMKIARSRTWSSYDEMMDAILTKINLYHPTVQSLASAERRWGRLLFTYYTWIRVAHSTMIDMAINHTAAMLAVPKAMYNYSVMQGFNPESPAVPFESQNVLPDYLAYSVYGPNAMDEQGPRSYRPPFLPLDVLDFWQVYIDPTKPADENALGAVGQVGRVIGKSTNILGAPIIAGLFGVDPSTGAPVTTTNAEAAVDEVLSNFGFMSLLTGMGLYTPYRYRDPESTNPLTDADRRRLFENSFSGMRSVDIYRPINVKKGESQYTSRVNKYNERIMQENVEKTQQFVDEKVSEGYTREQILQMLKEMGIN
jgi:hypothetical protein